MILCRLRLLSLKVLCLSFTCLGSLSVHAQDDPKLNKLTSLFERNIAGEAFLESCVEASKVSETGYFTVNAVIVDGALANVLSSKAGDGGNARAFEVLEQRRSQALDAALQYYKVKGCNAPKAKSAIDHIKMMGKIKASEMLKYLDGL